METRREFLKKTGVLLGGAALLGVTGCAAEPETVVETVTETVEVEVEKALPAYPYPCCEFDLDRVEKLAYEGYFENGCCYGVAKALLTELTDKVGYPFNVIPAEMFANGKEGYVNASLCGAMGGALGVIGLVCASDDARAITKQLNDWYTSTPLPIYQPEITAPVQTTSPTINCLESISLFMKEAGVERKDPIRKARCGGLSGDVAKKTAELLNIHFGYMGGSAVEEAPAAEETLAANEYIGEAEGFGGTIKVKVTMDGDKIANIEVLSHGETSGIADPAFNTIPQAIIDAQSADVDVVANATYTSNGIMAAVKDALTKVGK